MNDPKGILDEVKKAVVGKDGVLVMALLAILAGGHILLEDIPGVGKTTMALAFSKALSLKYNRVQFTPDVLPSDIVGFSVYNKATGAMEYKDGAILCNLFLADELNRATSRTQSALLEAMEERTVTVDGVTHPVPDPFVVIATQNPVGASGTQLLPDSQMDRFMVRLSLGYPKPSDEKEMLSRKQLGNPLDNVRCMADKGGLAAMRQEAEHTYVSEKILEYIIRLNNATRNDPAILQGASPRASLAVTSMSKAAAWVQGRDYVLPADVKLIYPATVAHRIILTPDAEAAGRKAEGLVEDILKAVPAPVAK
ncbi:MAG: MoxR family ATPase [Clostridia bacterium]|nr:MoxR family ATPase [Clostridia bacterium]MBQ9323962.1 MoxR family ATPase [Clostridia bacterium]MBQ9924137.1 MoxR family ATPase [Clostridia bacterium]MBR0422092.1 MoxR family ATPase [Clostridia bacterium]